MRAPGLYNAADLSNTDYHADTDYLSSSRLKEALPEWHKSGGSPDALAFGTLVHEVVLEPESLGRYTALDAAKIGVKSDGTVAQNPTMTAAWKRAVADAEAQGQTVIPVDWWDRAHRMRDAIAAHPEARALLLDGEGRYELSAFAVDGEVRVKARFDRLIPGAIVDLKTTAAKPGHASLTGVVGNYGYALSASHYLRAAELLGIHATEFVLVFVSKDESPLVTVCPLSEEWLEVGRRQRALALDRITGRAEPYEGATGRLTLYPPAWALDHTDEEITI